MADDAPKSPVNVNLEASAKLEVKAEIPSQSSGRLLEALTDIIRPFSESRGLKADQIRLQREDVLIQIADKARKRLEAEGVEPKSIPNKFMVPFLEQASTEDGDSQLIGLWAQLLARASMEYDSSLLALRDTLAKIGYKDFKLLSEFLDNPEAFPEGSFLWSPAYYSDWVNRWKDSLSVPISSEDFANAFFHRFRFPGVRLVTVNVRDDEEFIRSKQGHTVYSQSVEENTLSLDVLVLNNLIQRDFVPGIHSGSFHLTFAAYRITSLGKRLIEVCKEEEKKNVQ